MRIRIRQSGFSMSEVLIAVAILMVGMLLVAGTFPVGIHLTAISTERTIGAAAADEAFAKVRIYTQGVDFNTPPSTITESADFNDLYTATIDASEFDYPSVADTAVDKLYCWSAIFRYVSFDDPAAAQVTVFVSRKVAPGLEYYEPEKNLTMPNHGKPIDDDFGVPKPVKLEIKNIDATKRGIELESAFFNDPAGEGFTDYITDESVIVDDKTSEIYRVIEIDADNDKFIIDKDWQSGSDYFWVVPPPVGGGRSPCVGVYQRTMNF